MPSRPRKVSDRPILRDLADARSDVLADVLGVSLLRRAVYKRVEARAPWGLRVAYAQHAVFYLFVRGGGRLEAEGEVPLVLAAGDAVLVPHGTRHVLRDAPTTAPLEGHDGRRCLEPGARTLGAGAGGATTSILGGYFDLGGGRPPALLAGLPTVVPLRATDTAVNPGVAATLALVADEARRPGPASALVLQRLADVLFVQALRSLARSGGPPGHRCERGGLAALTDDAVSAALSHLHQAPEHGWTVASLAAKAGLSRSAFAARFAELVGEPPLEYLARWRMTRAAELLRDTDEALDTIAERVGYDSVPSFSRAFVRVRGERPGAFRRAARESRRLEAMPGTAGPLRGSPAAASRPRSAR